MNLQKIKETFSTRKRITKKALEDLYNIFEWVTEQVDNITTTTTAPIIHLKASWYSQDNSHIKIGYDEEDSRTAQILIINGSCGLYVHEYEYDVYTEILYPERIDYINLSEIIKGLNHLFSEIESVEIRADQGKTIAELMEIIRKSRPITRLNMQ